MQQIGLAGGCPGEIRPVRILQPAGCAERSIILVYVSGRTRHGDAFGMCRKMPDLDLETFRIGDVVRIVPGDQRCRPFPKPCIQRVHDPAIASADDA